MSFDRTLRIEKINLARLGYIIEHSQNETRCLLDKAEKDTRNKKNPSWTFRSVYDHIKKIYSLCKPEGGDSPYGTFHSSFNQPHGDEGRLNAAGNLSLQVMSRKIRHSIAEQIYRDIDIVNCHPVILMQYCKKYEIKCEALKDYVENREDIIKLALTSNKAMTRDSIKMAICSLLNGGNKDYELIKRPPLAFKYLSLEVKVIIAEVVKRNPDIYEMVKKKRKLEGKTYNIDGASMCVVLQSLENKMLDLIEQVFMGHGYSLEEMIPIHDGQLVPNKSSDEEFEIILRECEKEIEEQMDYKVDLIEKPLDSHRELFDFSAIDANLNNHHYTTLDIQVDDPQFVPINKEHIEFKEEDDIHDMGTYYRNEFFDTFAKLVDDIVERLPRYAKVIEHPASYVVNHGLRLTGDNNDHTWEIEVVSNINMFAFFKNKAGAIEGISIDDLLRRPLVARRIPVYKKMTFNPNPNTIDKKYLNMFQGFQAKQVEKVDYSLIKPIMDHIRECWCNDDAGLLEWLCAWFHQAFSRPWDKTGVVPILFGAEGDGKSCIIDSFIRPLVYGRNCSVTVQGLSKIVQRFNSVLMNKLFICANEANSSEGFHGTFEILKAICTDPTFCFEKKGLDTIGDYPLPCNIILTTNNHDSVKLGRTDRRYCPMEVSSKFRNDFEYFIKLHSAFTQEAANHFYTYKLNLPDTINVRKIPMTSLKAEMLESSKNTIEKYTNNVSDLLEGDRPDISRMLHMERWDITLLRNLVKGDRIQSRDLYASYILWCKENHETVKTNTIFGREIKKLYKHAKSNGSIYYSFSERT